MMCNVKPREESRELLVSPAKLYQLNKKATVFFTVTYFSDDDTPQDGRQNEQTINVSRNANRHIDAARSRARAFWVYKRGKWVKKELPSR